MKNLLNCEIYICISLFLLNRTDKNNIIYNNSRIHLPCVYVSTNNFKGGDLLRIVNLTIWITFF